MLIWEGPETTLRPTARDKDWQTLRRVKNQLTLIRLEMAAQAWTSMADAARRDRDAEQHVKI